MTTGHYQQEGTMDMSVEAIAKRRVEALLSGMQSPYDSAPYKRRDELKQHLATRGTSAVGLAELRLLEEVCEGLDRENEAEHKAEMDAENAWLRHAEAPTMDDWAFERYEQEMGLGLGDFDGGEEA